MLSDLWDVINTPLLYATPFFALFAGIELASFALLDRAERRDPGAERPAGDRPKGHSWPDSRTNLVMGMGSLVSTAVLKAATLVLFVYLYAALTPWHLPTDTWWSWVLLLIAVDLAWYTNHRFSHRVRIGWAGHQAHHSSEYFNLTTAVRQKWNPWSEAIFWAPLPLLGFAPWTIYVAFSFNLIYQFFTHTEAVGKLPRPVEFVLNTPSHHRVHHASDPEYLDKNYGGILIVWDRLFGTFQEETHRPTYGLTKPVDTYNVFTLQYHEYGNILADVRSAPRLRDKLGYVFRPPGWKPAPPAGAEDGGALAPAGGS
ncbi:sterol desaturase family protein [Streptomyces albidoflavus]